MFRGKRELLYYKVLVVNKVINENKADFQAKKARIEIALLKNEKKKFKRLLDELLEEDSSRYVDYVTRKRSELEKKLLLITVGATSFIGYAFVVLFLIVFGIIEGTMATFAVYILSAVALVFSLYSLTFGIKDADFNSFVIGILGVVLNGFFAMMHLSNLL